MKTEQCTSLVKAPRTGAVARQGQQCRMWTPLKKDGRPACRVHGGSK